MKRAQNVHEVTSPAVAVALRPGGFEILLERCAAPALLIEPDGRVTSSSVAARGLFTALGRDAGSTPPVRSLLGLGWRELLPLARDGGAELLLQLPAGAAATPGGGTRIRLEPLLDAGGGIVSILALLEPVGGRSRAADRGGASGGTEDPFGAIFGLDPRLRQGMDLARRFAATSLPVLLLARTGTGKDLLARAIHRASPRAAGPFVAINCGGLSPHLLESELFGYAPGAFTGARREGQEGKIGAAAGGTLFLDEVAEMPRPLQAILLRFLEDGTFYRVGDNVPRQSDVRLICATCRDLPRLVEEGAFRQDLFYRIKGACITLPALAERQDLEELGRFLLERICRDLPPGEERRLSPEAVEWIRSHPWPGNVRELKNALRHAVALSDGEIRREHLPVPLVEMAAPSAALPPPRTGPSRQAPAPTLDEAEGAALRAAIEADGGNLSAAARTLGIARSTLYRLMERHGLPRRRG